MLFIDEAERISADARLIEGSIEVDISALTGGSTPVDRGAGDADESQRPLHSPVLVLSGTTCVAGSAVGVIHGTDSHTELGRIAALSRQVRSDMSPLERQVRRVAWMIAGVAIAVGVAVSPTGV